MSKKTISLPIGAENHIFDCVANQNPLVRVFVDTSPGAMVLANRITEQFRMSDSSNTGTRFTSRIVLPVPAIAAGNVTPDGYALPAKAAGENRAIIQVDLSKFATAQQVEDFIVAVQGYVASEEYSEMLYSQLMC